MKQAMDNPGVPVKGDATRIWHKQKSWRWIEGILTNMLDDPSINGIVDNFRDVTERKHAEQLLIESEQFNKGILASLRSHIAVINKSGTIISVNKAWEDFAKANKDEPDRVSTGSNYYEVCEKSMANGDDLAGKTLAGIKSVFNKEVKTFHLDYPCHSPSEQRWFALYVSPFGEDDTKVVISHQNITERIKAENKVISTSAELQTAHSELKKIFDSSLDVICTINADGEFVNVSTASQNLWSYSPEELVGSKFMNLVYHKDADVTSKAAEKIVSGVQVPIFENRFVHKSGRVVPILWSVKWDEKLRLMFRIAKDVTEKKRLEKAIETERDQFMDIFSKAPSVIGMLKGADHVFEMANPLYLKFIGKKDLIGRTVSAALPEMIETRVY